VGCCCFTSLDDKSPRPMAPQTIPRYFYPRDPFLFFGWNEVKSVSWSSSLLLLYMSKNKVLPSAGAVCGVCGNG
jgi:hypothetical protein